MDLVCPAPPHLTVKLEESTIQIWISSRVQRGVIATWTNLRPRILFEESCHILSTLEFRCDIFELWIVGGEDQAPCRVVLH